MPASLKLVWGLSKPRYSNFHSKFQCLELRAFQRGKITRGHILAPMEGLRDPVLPRSTPGSTPYIREWFKGDLSKKKNCDACTLHGRTDAWTDRCDGRNSDVDYIWPHIPTDYLCTVLTNLELVMSKRNREGMGKTHLLFSPIWARCELIKHIHGTR